MTAHPLTNRSEPLGQNLLERPVDGQRIPAGSTLGDVLASGDGRATLLVFLRHYG